MEWIRSLQSNPSGPLQRVVAPLFSLRLSHQKYRADIDGLRAIAVLAVVGFHAFPNRVLGGFVGVDIFFVISGYLISTIIFYNLEHDSFSYTEFYTRRVRRIFPALLLVLTVSLIYGWLSLLAKDYQQLGKHVAAGAGFISNFVLWNESGYFDNASDTKPLLHLWSLGIEEHFYILWPVLIGAMWRRRLNFLVATLLVAFVSFFVSAIAIHNDPVAAFYSPLSRFWELMVGGILAYVLLRKPHVLSTASDFKSFIGLGLIGASIILYNKSLPFPGWWALLPTMGAFLVISAGPEAWLNRNLLASRLFVFVGLISYPLYLWHWPMLSFATIAEDGTPSAGVRIGVVVLSIVLAVFTYALIERPIQYSNRKKSVIYLLCIALAFIASCGAFVYVKEGVASRLINDNPAGFDFDLGGDPKYYQCFLDEKIELPFPNFCDGIGGSNSVKPRVLIWGDSHANSLSLGLESQSKLFGFELAHYTASGCPPLIDFAVTIRRNCQLINEFVVEKIKQLKPKTVIMAAYWSLYNGYNGWALLDYGKLNATFLLLKELGIDNIILVGPLPTFLVDEPKVANKIFLSGSVDRTFYKFNFESVSINERLRSLATEDGIKFVSPYDLLCNKDGCLISTSKTTLVPLAWDYGHLTKAGSVYLIGQALRANELALP